MNRTSSLILCASLVAVPAVAPGKTPGTTDLHFGSEPWHLALALGDLKPTEGAPSSPDRQVYTYNDDEGFVLSVIVENAHEPATMASCRDVFARRKAEMQPDNEVEGERGEAATQEYDESFDFQDKKVVQHDAFSCRVRGNWYVDVHASKILYQPSDHDALMRLVDGVAIVQ